MLQAEFESQLIEALRQERNPRPPVHGYNYESQTLAAASVDPDALAGSSVFPSASFHQQAVFNIPVVIVGIWMASTIANPAAANAGIFVVKNNVASLGLNQATRVYIAQLSQSAQVTSRTGGVSFGETSGIKLNANQPLGIYLSGDADTSITYCTIFYWIGASVFENR